MDVVEALTRLGGIADAGTLVEATSRRKVRTALTAGVIVRDARGHYALPTAEEGARAAARLSGVCSHLSAAAAWGWRLKRPPSRPHVTVPRKRKVPADRREGVHLHFAALTADERRRGVTDPGRTVIDCAKRLPFDVALAVADSALRAGHVTAEELKALAEQVHTTGRTECLRVAREADGRADNPFESVLRAVSLDVPGLRLEPQQVLVTSPQVLRPDLVDHRLRIVVEAGSFEFHGDRAALARDCERYNELGALGWTVYRFTWGHVMNAPWYVRQVLTAAVAARTVGAGTVGGPGAGAGRGRVVRWYAGPGEPYDVVPPSQRPHRPAALPGSNGWNAPHEGAAGPRGRRSPRPAVRSPEPGARSRHQVSPGGGAGIGPS